MQLVNAYKCSQYGISFVQKYFDVTNAFYSVYRFRLEKWISTTHEDKFGLYKNAITQIVDNSVSICRGSDKSVLLSAEYGVPPGFA